MQQIPTYIYKFCIYNVTKAMRKLSIDAQFLAIIKNISGFAKRWTLIFKCKILNKLCVRDKNYERIFDYLHLQKNIFVHHFLSIYFKNFYDSSTTMNFASWIFVGSCDFERPFCLKQLRANCMVFVRVFGKVSERKQYQI